METLIGIVKELSQTVSQNTRIIEMQTRLIEEQEGKIKQQRQRISRNEKQIFLLLEKCKVLHSNNKRNILKAVIQEIHQDKKNNYKQARPVDY